MKLRDYLPEIRHAVATVMADLHIEHDRASELRQEVEQLMAATESGYARVEAVASNLEEFDDDPMLATATYWETYFGVDKERYYKDEELQRTINALAAKEISLSALAGSLLQYAKQGIALQYGRQKHGCPDGRSIGSQAVSEVIWQARNQSIHWEDGAFKDPVENCFTRLAAEIHPEFGDFRDRNMAYDVVSYLGWRTFADFEADLVSLDL